MKTRNSHGLLQLGREALAYCQCASALISGNKALFVSVDLIGEKNQVILEFTMCPHISDSVHYGFRTDLRSRNQPLTIPWFELIFRGVKENPPGYSNLGLQ